MIISVTLNAAIDRTVAVPNLRLGHRHRSVETRTVPGGKGINVARALGLLGRPVIATGLVVGGNGDRVLKQLGEEGLLTDFIRIAEETRFNLALVDPTTGEQTEVNERGPRVSPEELDAYYRGAQGLIVPSVCYETFGIILIESFRLGTPVIARRLGPFPEIVETSGAGLLFETEGELVQAMRSFQSDPGLRDRLSRAARRGFEERWREDVVMAAWGRALARAARRKGDRVLAERLEDGLFEDGIKPQAAQ